MKMRASTNKRLRILSAFLFATIAATVGLSQQMQEPGGALDLSKYKLSLFYQNDFEKRQKIVFERDLVKSDDSGRVKRTAMPDKRADWIVEGNGGVKIQQGRMIASPLPFDANGKQMTSAPRSHLVIWNSAVFPADFLAEFEMNANGSSNGLTIVFFCAAGKNGEDIFDLSLPVRKADYKNYHSGAIANYSDAYWSRNTKDEAATNRLRKNPGFTLEAQGESLTTGPTDTTHRVRLLKYGGHIEIEIDAHVVLKWDDVGTPLGAGRIGFRSMEGVSLITYDNFKVWELSKK